VASAEAAYMARYTVFIDPQLGRVGLDEEDARAAGQGVRIARACQWTKWRGPRVTDGAQGTTLH